MKTLIQPLILALGAGVAAGWLALQAGAQQITAVDYLPRLTFQTTVGALSQIQYTNAAGASNWSVLTTLMATQAACVFMDESATNVSQRFYRVVDPTRTRPLPGMVWIPGGSFVMGSPAGEALRDAGELEHTVTVSGFYMSRFEVTQAEYRSILGYNLTNFQGDLNRPVEFLNWFDATNYCHLLNVKEGRLDAQWRYRLPTEAEWEYACRAGTRTPFHTGQNLLAGMANFAGVCEYIGGTGTRYNPSGLNMGRTTAVGWFQRNAFGLYDMHGNAWEWCLDWYGPYSAAEAANPRGPDSGDCRVARGGDCSAEGQRCRSAARFWELPWSACWTAGVRPVLASDPP